MAEENVRLCEDNDGDCCRGRVVVRRAQEAEIRRHNRLEVAMVVVVVVVFTRNSQRKRSTI